MNQQLKDTLKQLPKNPGVYFHKDADGEVIYVGKAANLRSRVRSYFQNSRPRDVKTQALIKDIVDIDWLETDSEVEALFLESELVKRYQPKYNIDLRDDKQFLYVKFTNDEFPRVWLVRRPLDDGAEYFGPFTDTGALRKTMRQLRRSFPYVTHRTLPERGCLHYHIGLCPGPEERAITPQEYRKTLQGLRRYLRGKSTAAAKELERQMKRQAREQNYEAAARTRNQWQNLERLSRQRLLSDKELFDTSRDSALEELRQLLGLEEVPRRLEAFDVSHTQGTYNVASMVVFSGGVPDRGQYRKFRLRKGGNDDYAHMYEAISRRLKRAGQWPAPEVIIIDGGKGQVQAALEALDAAGMSVPVIGLAKRFEEIIIPGKGEVERFESVIPERTAHVIKLLQHIRDEAHRFAITYHSQLRNRQQTASELESVPGIGPVARKKLLRHFGSLRRIRQASEEELRSVVSSSQARNVSRHIQ